MGKSLKREFVTGVFYTSLAKYSGILVQIVVTAILARLLDPEDFGVVAVATIVINFFNTFSDAGLGPAIIQRKEFTLRDCDAVFTFSIVIGLFLMFLFYSASDYIGNYYGEDNLKNVCRWLSVLILLSSLDVVPNSILLKDKKFAIIAYRTMFVQIVVGFISVLAAYKGWGIYSLVLSAILSKGFVFLFNYLMNPLLLNFKFGVLNTIKSYSFFQFMCNLMAYFARNLDKLVVGKVLGMNLLGFYEKSYRLMMLPLQNITFAITPVMQPLFSNFQNNYNLLMDKYLKLCRALAYLSFPLTVVVFFCSEELVLLFFGEKWRPAVTPFRILSLSIEIQVLQSSCGAIFQSSNNTKDLFFSSLISLVVMIAGLFVAAVIFKDLDMVSWSFVLTNFIGATYVFYILFKSFNRSMRELLDVLKIPLYIMLIEFLVMWVIQCLIYSESLMLSLFLKIVVWVFLSGALFLLFRVVSIDQLVFYARKIRK